MSFFYCLTFYISIYRITRPVFLELSSWPTLNFDGDLGSCPFDTRKQGKRESKLTNKEIKENKEAIESTNRIEVRYLLFIHVHIIQYINK